MLPLIDMANHSFTPNATVVPGPSGSLCMTAEAPIQVGQWAGGPGLGAARLARPCTHLLLLSLPSQDGRLHWASRKGEGLGAPREGGAGAAADPTCAPSQPRTTRFTMRQVWPVVHGLRLGRQCVVLPAVLWIHR